MRQPPYVPDWISGEVEAALRDVLPPTRARKHYTILRIADAAARDESIKRLLHDDPKTCSEPTWYGRYKGGEFHPGWRDDPAIARALQIASERAQRWYNTRVARSLQEAAQELALGAPEAAKELRRQVGHGERDTDRREAAKAVLDRAGVETAPKQSQQHSLDEDLERMIKQVYGEDAGSADNAN